MPQKPKILNERTAERFRAKIQDFVSAHAKASIELCWALYETDHALVLIGGQPTSLWEAWGYKSWREFVGVELGMHPTTAYCYRRVWEVFYVELAGAWAEKDLLPITKMRILCAAKMDKNNVTAWLTKAKKMTCPQLVAAVYGTEELHTFATSMTAKEMEAVRNAIEDARGAFGTDLPRGGILARMVQEWQTMHKTAIKVRGRLRLAG